MKRKETLISKKNLKRMIAKLSLAGESIDFILTEMREAYNSNTALFLSRLELWGSIAAADVELRKAKSAYLDFLNELKRLRKKK